MYDFYFGGEHLAKAATPRKICVPFFALTFAFALLGCERPPTKVDMLDGMSDESMRALDTMVNTPFFVAGLESPELIPASDARLKDSDQVIGVLINGQPRAYPLSHVSSMSTHVVNDCVLGPNGERLPFTITYCDMRDCIRVFEPTSTPSENSLGISTLGLLDRELALKWNGKNFKQTETVDGLRDVPFQRKTWAEWKTEFPDTMVYTGRTARGH
jgi:Protein of unknown function (DUF3179)